MRGCSGGGGEAVDLLREGIARPSLSALLPRRLIFTLGASGASTASLSPGRWSDWVPGRVSREEGERRSRLTKPGSEAWALQPDFWLLHLLLDVTWSDIVGCSVSQFSRL